MGLSRGKSSTLATTGCWSLWSAVIWWADATYSTLSECVIQHVSDEVSNARFVVDGRTCSLRCSLVFLPTEELRWVEVRF